MAFITTLISRLMNRADGAIKKPSDHYEALEFLRRNHDWIDVKVTKIDKSYQSLVLRVDPQNHELLIDDLYPAQDIEKIEPGDTIEISSKSHKAMVNFYTRILAREIENGKGAFRVELPEEIGHNHSRQAYRVFVSNEQGLSIDVVYNNAHLDDVRIINLSTEGIKLSFAIDLSIQLENDRIFEDCVIKLPSGSEIDCDIELRNVYQIRTPHPHTLGGGMLKIKYPQQRVKLEQYLAAVQRQQRRREARII